MGLVMVNILLSEFLVLGFLASFRILFLLLLMFSLCLDRIILFDSML